MDGNPLPLPQCDARAGPVQSIARRTAWYYTAVPSLLSVSVPCNAVMDRYGKVRYGTVLEHLGVTVCLIVKA